MKANESVPNFQSSVREFANYSARGIKKICKDIGPRPCGEEPEDKAHEYMANDLKSCSDTVTTESFEVHPKAFLGWLKIDAVLLLVTVLLLNLGLAAVTLPLLFVCLYCIVGEFLFYKEAIDFAFPKKTSHNTYATKKPTGEVKRHIIFCGHVDSSYEWRATYYGTKVLMFFTFIYAAVGLGVCLVAAIIACAKGQAIAPLATEGLARTFGFITLAFVPAFILLFWFLGTNRPVEGANDNLTGCFASASILKFMERNNISFENTEVSVLITGGEEAGLRGAKAFAKAHGDELRDKNIETCVIATDTLRDYDTMAIYKGDMSGITKNNEKVCQLLKKAGDMSGVEMEYSVVYAGASDAAAITQADIPATCFAAMDPGPPRYYHTRLDTAENLDLKTIEKGVEILLNALFIFDEQGLG